MRTENPELLDAILKYFYDNRLENILAHNIWSNFSQSDKEFYFLITDLENENFIYKSSVKKYSNPAMNMYRITSEGVKLYENGGIASKHLKQALDKQTQQIREQMEYQKLSDEIFDLRNRLQDYPKVKTQTLLSIIIAAVSLLVAILALLK